MILPDQLLQKAKLHAQKNHTTMTRLMEDALRAYLAAPAVSILTVSSESFEILAPLLATSRVSGSAVHVGHDQMVFLPQPERRERNRMAAFREAVQHMNERTRSQTLR